jgi:uncharacterized heparinase superfamily protein
MTMVFQPKGWLQHVSRSAADRLKAAAAVPAQALGLGGELVPEASSLLIVPQTLRTPDPAVVAELASGSLGLAGRTVVLDGASPFDVRPPSRAWEEALHEFAWLADMRAEGSAFARDWSRSVVHDWLQRFGRSRSGVAWNPTIAARRTISWLANAYVLLDDVEPRHYEAIMDSLNRHADRLVRFRDDASPGMPRLLARIAIMYATICLAGQESRIEEAERALIEELDRQIFPDGGHISRNPAVLIELLLDLLPLRQCFVSRGREPPPPLGEAIARMITMLRTVRMGDGSLARFNGMGVTPPDRLGAVLAYDEDVTRRLDAMPQSRYVRVQRRQTVVVMDVGAPPPVENAGEAHAGCLSFELSIGPQLVFVNAGAPGATFQDWRLLSRGTAAHNALVLDGQASGRLLRFMAGVDGDRAMSLTEPSQVEFRQQVTEGGDVELRGQHNGYFGRFGVMHSRLLRVNAHGTRLEGADRVFRNSPLAVLQPGRNLPFAIHFHCHPAVRVERSEEPGRADIALPSGAVWRFTAVGADLGLEESVFLANHVGPAHGVQIVLRGLALGDTEVRWRMEQIKAATRGGPLHEEAKS